MLHAHRLVAAEVPVRMRERTHRRVVDQLRPLGLLHDQGAAGDPASGLLRARPTVDAGDAAPVAAEHVALMDDRDPDRRDRRVRWRSS